MELATYRFALVFFVVGLIRAHPGLHEEIDALSTDIARDPSSWNLYLERAYRERLDGRVDRALADLDRAAKLSRGDVRVAAERGFVLSAMRRDSEALTELTRFLKEGTPTASVFVERARVHERRGNDVQALADFDAASPCGLTRNWCSSVARCSRGGETSKRPRTGTVRDSFDSPVRRRFVPLCSGSKFRGVDGTTRSGS